MTRQQAIREVVRRWGSNGATVAPSPGALGQPYEVGEVVLLPGGGARFIQFGQGRSWRAALADAARRKGEIDEKF